MILPVIMLIVYTELVSKLLQNVDCLVMCFELLVSTTKVCQKFLYHINIKISHLIEHLWVKISFC